MATRGTIRLISKNNDVKTYNHFDSYLSGLGDELLKSLKILLSTNSIDELNLKIDKIRSVDLDTKPSTEDIEKYKHLANLCVSSQTYEDWYCLLRESQGNLFLILENEIVIGHSGEEDYNYILDFNDLKFSINSYGNHLEYDFNNLPETINDIEY